MVKGSFRMMWLLNRCVFFINSLSSSERINSFSSLEIKKMEKQFSFPSEESCSSSSTWLRQNRRAEWRRVMGSIFSTVVPWFLWLAADQSCQWEALARLEIVAALRSTSSTRSSLDSLERLFRSLVSSVRKKLNPPALVLTPWRGKEAYSSRNFGN